MNGIECVVVCCTEGLRPVVDDSAKDLGTVVSYLVGRRVTTSEIVDAIGVSRSGFYLSRSAGRPVTADQLLSIAGAFDLNPVELLVRFGLLSADNATDYVDALRAGTAAGSDRRKHRGKRLRRLPGSPPL